MTDAYASLVDDCRAIVTETRFNSAWALVEGYHLLGRRIATDPEYTKHAKLNGQFIDTLANNCGFAPRTFYRAVRFYEKYPDLALLPEGKNARWGKIVAELLPENPPEPAPPCPTCGRPWRQK